MVRLLVVHLYLSRKRFQGYITWRTRTSSDACLSSLGSGNVDTWTRTNCGREALQHFVRFKAGPDVEFLWVEVVPCELVVRQRQRGVTVDAGAASGEAERTSDENGKPFANGLSSHSWRGPGERSTEALAKSGGSWGSGGASNFESLGGRQEEKRHEGFYVRLSDQVCVF